MERVTAAEAKAAVTTAALSVTGSHALDFADRLPSAAIGEYGAELIISEEIGAAKPAREFFDVTFARLGDPPKSEVLMIGDNWSSDIVGGVQYGLDTCWYNPSRQPCPNGLAIIREIAALPELTHWLND